MSANFVSLHNHTEYSFLDGAIKIKDLVKKAKEFDMPAVAITDHGGLFGAVEFYKVCKGEGVKPIIGFEAYVAPGSRFDKTQVKEKDERYYCHLILLAANNAGWKNLIRLSTIGYLEGFYYKPRIDMEALREHGEGIIATSACVAGAIPQALLRGDKDAARKLTEEYISIFGEGNFYFELQDHGIEKEKTAMKGLIELGREMGVPFITANDAHYLLREHAQSHEVLLCIGTQDTLANPNRYQFSSDQIYFKSPQEMAELFPDIPEAMTNTLDIAERCNVDILVKPQLPSVEIPAEYENQGVYLSRLARDGLRKRYAEVTPELEKRLEYELEVIIDMKFAGYFLIVLDFVRHAREVDVMVGCRGSAAGSLVMYSLGITDVDPIKYDLIFERFLNPERVSMPDADIDFADRGRYKIVDYVVGKYGRDAVCQIINFGTMAAKSAVKDVARVMGLPVGEQNRLSLMVGKELARLSMGKSKKVESLKEAMGIPLAGTPPLSKIIADGALEEYAEADNEIVATVQGGDQYRELFRHAAVLEGLTRQPGMHAAGVIIAPAGAVVDWAPLFKQSNAEEIMTQFDLNCVEEVGLVKMDFLGLKTLTVIQEALRLIKKYRGMNIDPWKLPEDDKKTFELFGSGETTGIFQFESNGMKDYLRKLKPTRIDDIIAMAALYRPGPMNNIDTYINRKHGRETIEHLHPLLEDILDVTYGIIVYQEQVMRIAQVMGGFSLGQADILRKAMGKKKAEEMAKQGDKFLAGAEKLGIDKKTARDVFDLMAKFAEYGFNKSHAAVYAHLSYQSAYLKVYFPLEYMTAYLSAYLGKMDDFLVMRNEAERIGVHVLPPDVNKSDYEFGVDGDSIRIGLGAVKNVGKAAELIIKAREEKGPFASMFDVCKSTDNRIVNKKALESLICAGAFDGFGGTRAQHFEAVDMALEYGKSSQAERASGQGNLFDAGTAAFAPEPALPRAAPWPPNTQLQKEKDILGFYVSGSLLDQYDDEIKAFSDADIASEEFAEMREGAKVTVGGIVTIHKPHTDRKGKPMAFVTLEAYDASIELLVFADAYAKYGDLLAADSMVLVQGSVASDGEAKPKLRVERCVHLSQARLEMTKSVHVGVSSSGLEEKAVRDVYDCCRASPGDCYLVIHVRASGGAEYRIRAGNIGMSPDREAIDKLRGMLGKENVWLAKTIS
jgi:DNA polymerase-3 subunit alpha